MRDIASDCACRAAVERVYREFIRHGDDDCQAFESAVRVYRFHHPEASLRNARYAVAEWVAEPED